MFGESVIDGKLPVLKLLEEAIFLRSSANIMLLSIHSFTKVCCFLFSISLMD